MVSTSKTKLEELDQTKSGSVRKYDAMEWLRQLDKPEPGEIAEAMVERPSWFEGSSFPASHSRVRIEGEPEFIETVAPLFREVLNEQDEETLVSLSLQEIEDRDTGKPTGNYALYLMLEERG